MKYFVDFKFSLKHNSSGISLHNFQEIREDLPLKSKLTDDWSEVGTFVFGIGNQCENETFCGREIQFVDSCRKRHGGSIDSLTIWMNKTTSNL